MAVAKLSALTVLGAAIPVFIRDNVQYAGALQPPFWMGKAACGNILSYMLPAFVLSAVWICLLLKRYMRKMQEMISAAEFPGSVSRKISEQQGDISI